MIYKGFGVLFRLFWALSLKSFYETVIRSHRHDAGARGGQQNQKLGRSCGGFSSKIHAKVGALGVPLIFIITAGQASDIGHAEMLVGEKLCESLLADKGYDSNAFLAFLEDRGSFFIGKKGLES